MEALKRLEKQGRVVIHEIESDVLKGNPLGDPTRRELHVYLPPGFEDSQTERLPVLLAVVGFTGTGAMLLNVDPLGEDLKSRLDRLIISGKCAPAIVVMPDCFTKFGGSQYINSSATGRYEDYLLEEVIPFVNQTYPIKNWGVFGKSSGGYGSIVLGMRHPDIFKALADHSGDSIFELCYLPGFAKALDKYQEAGGPAKWLEKFWNDPNKRKMEHMDPLNTMAMAANYSPNPESPHLGIDFPFDLDTGVFRHEIWERWRKWDPVNMVKQYLDNLKKLKLIYIDCGSKDEFALHWGARALVDELKKGGIEPIYEEFDDGHMNIPYRYDVSIPKLVEALR